MRGSFIIIFLSIGLFLLSASAEGANWELITMSEKATFYIDTESIRHISKNVVTAWVKTVFKKPEIFNSKGFVEVMNYEEHNCAELKKNVLQNTNRYLDGTSDTATYPEKEWTYIRPDTVESAVHNYLCKKGK